MKSDNNNKILTIWLWFAAATVIIGVIMLYPIGHPFWNVVFCLVKIGMLSGILLLMKRRMTKYFRIWAVFSGLAVVMTLIKWGLNGNFEGNYALAIATDIVVPAIGYRLLKSSDQ